MPHKERWSVSWDGPEGPLGAHEPSQAEVQAASARLAAWYNEEHNRSMMANQQDMDPGEVCAHYREAWEKGGRNFLLYVQGRLAGDADLRHVDPASRTAEFAIMMGERTMQGRGYGTRFALMLHALAFTALDLERVYVTIIPGNRGSLRLFEKLGYQRDQSPQARAYIDEPDDVTMSLGRGDFQRLHADAVRQLAIARRPAEDVTSQCSRGRS
jgi:RimJ/RimL family protein N-acetyltransferase